MLEKIQKVLARVGLGSRRMVETWISQGRIRVNGEVAHLGQRISMQAQVTLDGKRVELVSDQEEARKVLLYYKPEGEVCTRRDPEGRPTVYERLPKLKSGRWINIGRLDVNTAGLLLFTNDGELAYRLMHPRFVIEREYAVRVFGNVTPLMLQKLSTGIALEDGVAKFTQIKTGGGEGRNQWYNVVVTEGKYRMVRRLWESQGVQVSRLLRFRYGPIELPRHLRPSQVLYLSPALIDQLLAAVGMANISEQNSPKGQRPNRNPR